MRTYTIEPEIFARFPEFRRGVLVARHVNNFGGGLPEQLSVAADDHRRHAPELINRRLEVWNEAYRLFGANPDQHTPSIRFLHQQIARGKPLRSISKLVDVFNIISLRWVAPCGGDDLHAVGGNIRLGIADGGETFSPLFKPTASDPPERGEVIYFTPDTRKVMCRRWTWRNADFSKIQPATTSVAINIDMMVGPFGEAEVSTVLQDAATLVAEHCGGEVVAHVLAPAQPSFTFDR